ncbi:27325_t:CDS:2, partial [Racocetra persica]
LARTVTFEEPNIEDRFSMINQNPIVALRASFKLGMGSVRS